MLRPIVEQALVLPEGLISPVEVELTVANGVARGRLDWATTCRRVVRVRGRTQTVTHHEPMYETVPLNAITGFGAGLGGVSLLENRKQFSDREICEADDDDDGTVECTSPRAEATAWGVALAGYAIVATTAAIVTAVSPSSTEVGDVEVGRARQARVLSDGIPCGYGPVGGLRVALYRGDERIAAATTDRNGNLTFNLPDDLTGTLTLLSEFEDSRYPLVLPGSWLGEVVLEPTPP